MRPCSAAAGCARPLGRTPAWSARWTGSTWTSPRGDRGHHGAERLREVDPAAPAGRAGPAVGRGGSAGREPGGPVERAGPGPAAPGLRRVRVPGLPPDGRAHRGRERGTARAAGWPAGPGGAAAGDRADRAGRSGRTGRVPARGTVRGPAPAGGDRPRAGQRAAGGPGRRAHRQPGQHRRAGGAPAVREPARGRADAGRGHARLADRGHGGPDDLDAGRDVHRRDQADRRDPRLAANGPGCARCRRCGTCPPGRSAGPGRGSRAGGRSSRRAPRWGW